MASAKLIIKRLDEGFVLKEEGKEKAIPNYIMLKAAIDQGLDAMLQQLRAAKGGVKAFELTIEFGEYREVKQG